MSGTRLGVVSMVLLSLATPARAQPLGTFRWQLRPYCNVIAVTITQSGGLYRLEGTDDQCGGGRDQAAVIGMAFPNPDGTIGFGMTIVTAPGGAPVHVDAAMAIASLGGTWRDSAGGTGTFAFTPGAGTGGNPRPAPAPAIPAAIRLAPSGSVLASGTASIGAIPVEGPGTRMMWYPGMAAFRAGTVDAGQWDFPNTGFGSVAFGTGTTAFGPYSVALGRDTTAGGEGSVAVGRESVAAGRTSLAAGFRTRADNYGFAFGNQTIAGDNSMAGGQVTFAEGNTAFAFGYNANAKGVFSFALGRGAATSTNARGSFVVADDSPAIGTTFTSFAPNEFGARFAGGFYLYTSANLSTGAALAANSGSWANLSDANSKENFRDVDGEELLARLARVPVREWNYKAQGAGIRHMGPTAQDFRAAFRLGDFPLRINTVDADGVALAAIKALVARTDALRDDNRALRAALDEALRRLDAATQAARP